MMVVRWHAPNTLKQVFHGDASDFPLAIVVNVPVNISMSEINLWNSFHFTNLDVHTFMIAYLIACCSAC